jgi:alkylation response protein AidB-like acyl-CoA dehydrogenase
MRAVIKVAAKQGMTAMRVPKEYGGQGMTALECGMAYEVMPAFMFFAIGPQETFAIRICLAATRNSATAESVANFLMRQKRAIPSAGLTQPG